MTRGHVAQHSSSHERKQNVCLYGATRYALDRVRKRPLLIILIDTRYFTTVRRHATTMLRKRETDAFEQVNVARIPIQGKEIK